MSAEREVIAAIVLAAGGARRFGSQKLLAPLGGETVVHRTVRTVLDASVDDVVVVIGHEGDAVQRALADLPVRTVPNARWEEGMSASIAAGVSALHPDVAAAFVVLGDQPAIQPAVLALMLERRRAAGGGVTIVAPVYRGVQGNPVLFGADVFAELLALTGDRGARAVLERDPARVAAVAIDQEMPGDVDVPADLTRLAAHERSGR
ncbi:MAG TPA: nucleotidyltransferase family protein [Gemmatimonadaceae bacterium]|nr:nucleotidyltransferase family protein [Gemmatimonadaceae bacterium]